MPHSTPPTDIAVLHIAARLSAVALFATFVVATLIGAGALRASPTRLGVLAVAAFTFVNWLLRLRTEIGRRRFAAGLAESKPDTLAARILATLRHRAAARAG